MSCLKKNNKGFSLVELIVVILIMAIIAVALAPQIMKWVENSRIATDLQTKGNILSIMQVTVCEDDVILDIKNAHGATMVMNNTGITLSDSNGDAFDTESVFYKKFLANTDLRSLSDMKTKANGNYILLVIDDLARVVSAQYFDENNNVIEETNFN